MAFSGIAAVQARIQEIQQQAGGDAKIDSASSATAPTGTTGTDFASVLTNALSTQSEMNGGTGTPTGTGTGGATSPDITSLISRLTGSDAAGFNGALASGPNVTTRQFVETALAQQGKPYQWGATASLSDANPAAFDCSELTKWAAARSGATIPDGAAHQYVWLKEQGATMPVEQALRTPGALLFHFTEEPQPGLGSEPAHAHVAISLGNGKTIEAKGHAYGTGVFDAGDRFNYAGMIPGMT